MSREWQPGDVAMVTDSVGEKRLARRGRVPTDNSECWWYLDTNTWGPTSNSASPVVVIDPEDEDQVSALVAATWVALEEAAAGEPKQARWSVKAMQAALRSLAEPPKPPEPRNLGAVVQDSTGQRWSRVGTKTACWIPDGQGLDGRLWDELPAPVRVLHDGWAGEQS